MGAREICIGYGQTEASPIITFTAVDDPIESRVGTVGKPLPGIEVKLVDPVTRPRLASGRARRAVRPGSRRDGGLLQQPGRDRPGDRPRGVAAHRRPGPASGRRQLPDRRAVEGADHPGRREHLPARGRGVPDHVARASARRPSPVSPTASTAKSSPPGSSPSPERRSPRTTSAATARGGSRTSRSPRSSGSCRNSRAP